MRVYEGELLPLTLWKIPSPVWKPSLTLPTTYHLFSNKDFHAQPKNKKTKAKNQGQFRRVPNKPLDKIIEWETLTSPGFESLSGDPPPFKIYSQVENIEGPHEIQQAFPSSPRIVQRWIWIDYKGSLYVLVNFHVFFLF